MKHHVVLLLVTLVLVLYSCAKSDTKIVTNLTNDAKIYPIIQNQNYSIDKNEMNRNNITENKNDNSIQTNEAKDNSFFFVTFLDVEQGDCIILNSNGHFAMIDGGSSNESSKIYTYLKDNDIDRLDYMIASHPDSDHIGGLSGALNYATADVILCSKESNDKEYIDFKKYAEIKGAEIQFPSEGDLFAFGDSTIEILAVNVDPNDDNNSSIVLKISYGNTTFLFTGDAEKPVEEYLVNSGKDIDCDLLKVSHHGSKYASSQSFLEKVSPYISVICVGRSNSYGHPTNEVLNRLNSIGSKVYLTDSKNDIVCSSNKQDIYCVLTSH